MVLTTNISKDKNCFDELMKINRSYDQQHGLEDSDFKMVRDMEKAIENSRDNSRPQVGDIVEYTDKNGNFYQNAHIEKVEGNQLYICERPYVPFVDAFNDKIETNASGGAWGYIPANLKRIGTRNKKFKKWGHCGMTANGAVEFYATVNVWEYSENQQKHSTRTHDKFHVATMENDEEIKKNNGYKYLVSNMNTRIAFKTDKEYQNWLDTFKGVEFPGAWRGTKTVWTYKQNREFVGKDQYNNIKADKVDQELCNGKMRECKRVYTDTTVITYITYQ